MPALLSFAPSLFQHTAARRRLDVSNVHISLSKMFQHTAARRRLGAGVRLRLLEHEVSTHSRPKAAGICATSALFRLQVSTHSRPKAAGCGLGRAGTFGRFQHTAARRRLALFGFCSLDCLCVSTHSRPKAAGAITIFFNSIKGFNTQPPEGGWQPHPALPSTNCGFNTQPPEGGWT